MRENPSSATIADPDAPVREMRELLESVIFEDGLAAAVEIATDPQMFPEVDPVTRTFLVVELV
ncbi:hypothetical protein [Calidifontibacter terrae]